MTGEDYADDLVLLANDLPKLNLYCIVWSKQEEAFASTWMQKNFLLFIFFYFFGTAKRAMFCSS